MPGMNEEILAYCSRSFNPAKKNNSATELECLAVVWAVEKLNVPGGMTFHWRNRSFLSPVGVQDNQTQYPTDLFTFTVENRKGRYNTLPDALSRAAGDSIGLTHSSIHGTISVCLSCQSPQSVGCSTERS